MLHFNAYFQRTHTAQHIVHISLGHTTSQTLMLLMYSTKRYCWKGAWQRSQYSDLLWAGRPGDRIPVGARFSAPVQTDPAGIQPPTQWVSAHSQGRSGPDVKLTTHPHLAPRLKRCRLIPSVPLWQDIGWSLLLLNSRINLIICVCSFPSCVSSPAS
jgi:hypothetical protein